MKQRKKNQMREEELQEDRNGRNQQQPEQQQQHRHLLQLPSVSGIHEHDPGSRLNQHVKDDEDEHEQTDNDSDDDRKPPARISFSNTHFRGDDYNLHQSNSATEDDDEDEDDEDMDDEQMSSDFTPILQSPSAASLPQAPLFASKSANSLLSMSTNQEHSHGKAVVLYDKSLTSSSLKKRNSLMKTKNQNQLQLEGQHMVNLQGNSVSSPLESTSTVLWLWVGISGLSSSMFVLELFPIRALMALATWIVASAMISLEARRILQVWYERTIVNGNGIGEWILSPTLFELLTQQSMHEFMTTESQSTSSNRHWLIYFLPISASQKLELIRRLAPEQRDPLFRPGLGHWLPNHETIMRILLGHERYNSNQSSIPSSIQSTTHQQLQASSNASTSLIPSQQLQSSRPVSSSTIVERPSRHNTIDPNLSANTASVTAGLNSSASSTSALISANYVSSVNNASNSASHSSQLSPCTRISSHGNHSHTTAVNDNANAVISSGGSNMSNVQNESRSNTKTQTIAPVNNEIVSNSNTASPDHANSSNADSEAAILWDGIMYSIQNVLVTPIDNVTRNVVMPTVSSTMSRLLSSVMNWTLRVGTISLAGYGAYGYFRNNRNNNNLHGSLVMLSSLLTPQSLLNGNTNSSNRYTTNTATTGFQSMIQSSPTSTVVAVAVGGTSLFGFVTYTYRWYFYPVSSHTKRVALKKDKTKKK